MVIDVSCKARQLAVFTLEIPGSDMNSSTGFEQPKVFVLLYNSFHSFPLSLYECLEYASSKNCGTPLPFDLGIPNTPKINH